MLIIICYRVHTFDGVGRAIKTLKIWPDFLSHAWTLLAIIHWRPGEKGHGCGYTWVVMTTLSLPQCSQAPDHQCHRGHRPYHNWGNENSTHILVQNPIIYFHWITMPSNQDFLTQKKYQHVKLRANKWYNYSDWSHVVYSQTSYNRNRTWKFSYLAWYACWWCCKERETPRHLDNKRVWGYGDRGGLEQRPVTVTTDQSVWTPG